MSYTNSKVSFFAGETVSLGFTITDSDGAAINLTGATLTFYLARLGTQDTVLTKTTGSGITVVSAADGTCTVALTSSNTDNLEGLYIYQLRLVDSSNAETVVSIGEIWVDKSLS